MTNRALRRRLPVLALGLVALLAACGGGGSEGADGDGGDEPVDRDSQAVAYSQCMRENGVTDFPDPDENGRLLVQRGPGSAGDMEAASKACEDLRPEGLGGGANGEPNPAMLELAECMRANGVPGFPDPTGGGIRISPDMGFDPNSPEFAAAMEICRDQTGLQLGGGQ